MTTTNAVATDLSNVPNGHFIGEKLPDLVDAQIFRVISNKVFAKEADYIKLMCERNDIKKIVDFGCWTGILAKEIFDTGIKLDNYHLIDAVPFYMNKALEILADQPEVTHELVTLLPPSFKGTPPTTMLIHPYDTLNSSSIYSNYFLKDDVKQANVRLPMAPSQALTDYITKNADQLGSNTYVKVDLDGVDIEMVSEMIKAGVRPGAVQFEVWNTFKGGYTKIIKIIEELGYKVPAANLHIHQSFSVGISKNYWWAVGYDNLGTGYNCTYYDMEHGEVPVSL